MSQQCSRVARFERGHIQVATYLNETPGGSYYDVVIYRKIRVDGKMLYRRGANLKPDDLPLVISLLQQAAEYIESNIPS